MEFFKIRKDMQFMRHALVFNVISVLTFLLAVFFLATRGLKFGVDFTGGTVMEVSYPQTADLPAIRALLERSGYAEVTVQNFGTSQDVLIRLAGQGGRGRRQAVGNGDGNAARRRPGGRAAPHRVRQCAGG